MVIIIIIIIEGYTHSAPCPSPVDARCIGLLGLKVAATVTECGRKVVKGSLSSLLLPLSPSTLSILKCGMILYHASFDLVAKQPGLNH